MRKETLPRGIHRRNGSLVISYSVAGRVRYQSLGDCSLEFAKDQLRYHQDGNQERRHGNLNSPITAESAPVVYKVEDLWQPYLTHYGEQRRQGCEPTNDRVEPSQGHLRVGSGHGRNHGSELTRYIAGRQAKGISNGTVNRESRNPAGHAPAGGTLDRGRWEASGGPTAGIPFEAEGRLAEDGLHQGPGISDADVPCEGAVDARASSNARFRLALENRSC